MKKFCNLLLITAVCIFSLTAELSAQCGGGYTQAQLNWDYLDYYFNSGGSNPYSSYISDTREMSQRFGIGTTWVTITTSVNTLVNPGTGGTITAENGLHTAESGSYGTGNDVQYTGNGTITITFASAVQNLQFSIYDVDRSQRIQFGAVDGATARNITLSSVSGTILTFTNNGTTTARVDAANTTVANTSTDGTVNVDIAGPVTSVTLTVSNTATCTTSCGSGGTENPANYWLSDINACVTGSFPTNWHQGFNNQPWQGNVENQPDYFLVTPDNNSGYMMDPATGRCWWQFTDASKTYMNSYAYDPQNKILYYISENVSANSANKELKKYDFNTESYSTVIADIGTTLGIPTFNYGVESAAAAFYNGKLYLGIEGGQSTSIIRESTVWCVDLSTNTAYQVFATDCYGGGAALHDYADLLVKDGVLINYNSARTGTPTYPNSSFTHFDFMTGAATKYMNPDPAKRYSGQAGMSWNGNMYMIFDSVWAYSNGVISNPQDAVVVNVPGDPVPPAWAGNAGDASDPFRPKCDFGDAPASYDPEALKPAVHERSEAIRLGATWDREWVKKGVSGTDDTDDGTPYLNFLPQGSGDYLAHTYVTNNSGSTATLIAWLDYNANGVFDASEAVTAQSVPTGTNNQLYWLYWPNLTTPLLNGQSTYMRVRITSGAMTAADATGYFSNGEVEDYEVNVDDYPLSVNNLSFTAAMVSNSYCLLNWTVIEEAGFTGYEVQKSRDAVNWEYMTVIPSSGQAGEHQYNYTDRNPHYGKTYYRLKLIGVNGSYKFSETRVVTRLKPDDMMTIKPNPAKHSTVISIESNERTLAQLQLFTENGKRIFAQSVELNNGRNEVPLPVKGEWPAGVYMVRVIINNEIISKKMIIEK